MAASRGLFAPRILYNREHVARTYSGALLLILRRIAFLSLLVLLALLAAVFAYSNPDPIDVDIGFARLQGVSLTVAFAAAFAFGWLFGLLCAAMALLRMVNDKRRLRRNLRLAEAEISSLRGLPLQDAN